MNLAENIDEKLFLKLNGVHSATLDYFMTLASNLFFCIPVLFLVGFVATRHFKKQNEYPVANSLLLIFVLLLEFVFCLEIVPDIFSSFLQRERPCLNPNISALVRLVGEDCNSGYSFFALRPFIMFFITSFLFFSIRKELPIIKWLLVIWSVIVSYSRIYLGAHYPFNVVVADLAGIAVGFIGSRVYLYLKYKVLVL
jgi:undecaprenyl-diphosphatase